MLPVTTLPHAIQVQLADAHAVIAGHLGSTLRAIHLFSSAVDGGLKPRSDIDLMVTIAAPMDDSTRRALTEALLTVSAPPGTDMSRRALEVTVVVLHEIVPWRYPARREMQFGEWLRDDILAGRFEPAVLDHDLAILLIQVLHRSVNLFGPPAAQLFESVPTTDLMASFRDTIAQWRSAPDWEGDEQTVVLALARIWYSAVTGRIGPKDLAAAWVLERLPPAHRPVLAGARDAYLGQEAYGPCGPAQMAAFVQCAKQEIERALTQ